MRFSILTIHPKIAEAALADGLLAKAVEAGRLDVRIVDIREFSTLPHKQVDDKPFGGGPGMLMRPEPLVAAIEASRVPGLAEAGKEKVVVLSAKGQPYVQKTAEAYSRLSHLILVCGRYEGIDERVIEHYCDEEVRIGDYVLMGGELAAGVVLESAARLVPGVLGNEASVSEESFQAEGRTEYPQYTRPREFAGYEVPDVLVSGDHQRIKEWREKSQ